jgi:hypothetical protein
MLQNHSKSFKPIARPFHPTSPRVRWGQCHAGGQVSPWWELGVGASVAGQRSSVKCGSRSWGVGCVSGAVAKMSHWQWAG